MVSHACHHHTCTESKFFLMFPMLFHMLQRRLSSAYKAEGNTAELLSC